MARVEAQKAHRRAMEVAAREIERLALKEKLEGWDSAELERYAGICRGYDDHELKWLQKLDPSKLPDELVQRVLAADEEEKGGKPRKRSAA
jgi:hypothetical protein